MRRLTSLETQEKAEHFSQFLLAKGCECTIEQSEQGFDIWIVNEDMYDIAKAELDLFLQDPTAQAPTMEKEGGQPGFVVKMKPLLHMRRRLPLLTNTLIALCIALFFLNWTSITTTSEKYDGLTPIYTALLFDYTEAMQKADTILNQYTGELTKEEIAKAAQVEREGTWNGLWALYHKAPTAPEPQYEKIGQGEVYRVVTPIFLHGGILHILFNMLWLYLLGPMVETRTGITRYLLLTLIIACVSNVAQYIASGPLFLGYSGVICGLAGFIWARQMKAPWEGYPLGKSTVLFLFVFVVAIGIMQIVLLGYPQLLPMQIANTAHVAGGITGVLFGMFPLFKKRAA